MSSHLPDDDSDERFLGYVELHAATERHLFSRADILRLHQLADVPLSVQLPDFAGMDRAYAGPLVEQVRARLRAMARLADTALIRDRLRNLLREHSVRTDRTFTLKSGRTSDFFVDCKRTVLTGEGHRLVGRVLLRALYQHFPDVEAVAGVALGGCPLASAVSTLSAGGPTSDWSHPYPLNALYVRAATKDHGTEKRIEGGIFDPNLHVVLLEDVVTTGGSSLAACDALHDAGCRLLGVIALVDREEGASQAFWERHIPLHAIFTQKELRS